MKISKPRAIKPQAGEERAKVLRAFSEKADKPEPGPLVPLTVKDFYVKQHVKYAGKERTYVVRRIEDNSVWISPLGMLAGMQQVRAEELTPCI